MTFVTKRNILLAAALAVAPIFGALNTAKAASSISDGNSTLTFNPTDGSLPYISSWVVDGVDQYGGSPAGGETLNLETSNPTLSENYNSLPVVSSFFGSGIASVTYGEGNLTINVKDVLTGGNAGSGASAINEIITINNTDTNTADDPLIFSTHNTYVYNVNGTANNDTLTLSPSGNANTATQTDPSGATVTFSTTPGELFLQSGGTVIPGNGPVTGVSFLDSNAFVIDPGGSAQISVTETLTGGTTSAVPLPNSAYSALLTLAGLGAIGGYRRMRRAV